MGTSLSKTAPLQFRDSLLRRMHLVIRLAGTGLILTRGCCAPRFQQASLQYICRVQDVQDTIVRIVRSLQKRGYRVWFGGRLSVHSQRDDM